MLSKEYRLSKTKGIERVHKNGGSSFTKILGIKFLKNNLPQSRFTVVAGLKIHKKSTKRNLVKRRLREITRANLQNIKPGFDVVILARPGILEADFAELEKNLSYALKKAGLLL